MRRSWTLRTIVALLAVRSATAGLADDRKSTTKPSGAIEKPSADDVKPEFHAIGAGNPGADGWVLGHSTSGRFSVEIPGRYNDFSISAKSVHGNDIVTHVLGGMFPNVGKFSVSRISGGDAAPTDVSAKAIAEKMAKENRPFSKTTVIQLPDGPAYEFEIANLMSPSSRGRIMARDGTMVLMIVEYPATQTTKETLDRFFSSFRIEPPPEKK